MGKIRLKQAIPPFSAHLGENPVQSIQGIHALQIRNRGFAEYSMKKYQIQNEYSIKKYPISCNWVSTVDQSGLTLPPAGCPQSKFH